MSSNTPHRTLAHSSVEASLRGAGVLDHPAVLAALAPYGYDPRRPRLEYDWAIRDALEEAIPHALGWPGPREAQLYRVGRAMFIGWGETIIGRVLSAPLNQATPQRAMHIMTRILSMRPEFGSHVLTMTGPRAFLIRAAGDPRHPPFVAGMVVPAVELAGGQQVQWHAEATGPEAYDLTVEWEAEGPPGQLLTL